MIWIYFYESETKYEFNNAWKDVLTPTQFEIMNGDFKVIDRIIMDAPKEYRSDLKDLLLSLLDPNPDTRISINKAVKNNFFKGLTREPGYQEPGRRVRPLTEEQRRQLKSYINDLGKEKCEAVFLFADLVHRGIESIDSDKGDYDYWNDYLPLCLDVSKGILDFDGRFTADIWHLLRALDFVVYRINLYTIARNKEDLLDLLPYLWHPDYNKINLEKLFKMLPYRDDNYESKDITLNSLLNGK